MEILPESQSQQSLVSFQSPFPPEFLKRDTDAELSGSTLLGMGTTDSDVSDFSSTPINVIEDFWLQFYNDNGEDYNAGVADSGSGSDVGKFFLLFKSCIVSELSFIVAVRSPSIEAS